MRCFGLSQAETTKGVRFPLHFYVLSGSQTRQPEWVAGFLNLPPPKNTIRGCASLDTFGLRQADRFLAVCCELNRTTLEHTINVVFKWTLLEVNRIYFPLVILRIWASFKPKWWPISWISVLLICFMISSRVWQIDSIGFWNKVILSGRTNP